MKQLGSLIVILLAAAVFSGCTPKKKYVVISTSFGDMKVMLYDDTPQHRDNFLKLVEEGYFNGTTFHRVINGFMVQGGDPNTKAGGDKAMIGQGGPGYTIPAEILPNHIHKRGALSAARLGDAMNPKKESSGSQFYVVQGRGLDIETLKQCESMVRGVEPSFVYSEQQTNEYLNKGGYPWLDMQYTVFGEVVEGLEVIDKIAAVQVDASNNHIPLEDIPMTMSVVEE